MYVGAHRCRGKVNWLVTFGASSLDLLGLVEEAKDSPKRAETKQRCWIAISVLIKCQKVSLVVTHV